VKIMSARLKELPDGRVGEICFDSPSRMQEYLANTKETQRVLVGNLLRTGDIGYLREGELFWLGRKRERINVNGRKYDPSDFERALFAVDGLRKGCFAAFGIADAESGTDKLIIICEKSVKCNLGDAVLMRSIAGSINLHLGIKPSEVILLEAGSMSKTSSGKRRHRHYRNLYLRGKFAAEGN
jgi:fatty-acyl-CoA synthase